MEKEKELKGLSALDIPKARMKSFKKYMDNYPLHEEADYSLIKNTIQSIPKERSGLKEDSTFQDTVDTSYNSLLQELITSTDCDVYYESANIKLTRTMVKNFLTRTLDSDRLQTDNIFLTTDLWQKAIFTPKKTIGGGFFNRTVDYEILRANFSELAVSKDENNNISLPVLTTIQFDNYSNPDGTLPPINYTRATRLKFERIFTQLARANDIESIYELADLSRDFSIHSYYIPNGISTKKLGHCCLLLRYDHSSFAHHNGAIPQLYRHIYQPVVREPHFHFNSGFGSIYKLTPQMLFQNLGVGYAIGVTALKEYLEKLYKENFKDNEERKLYMENDFGMPFLHFKLADIENGTDNLHEFLETIKQLAFDSHIASESASLDTAYKFISLVSSTKTKPLHRKKIAGCITEKNDDIKKW